MVLDQGGLAPGGLNFDCKVRRESTRVKDMFIAHIGTNHTVIIHKYLLTKLVLATIYDQSAVSLI